jgi:hypothetical protein
MATSRRRNEERDRSRRPYDIKAGDIFQRGGGQGPLLGGRVGSVSGTSWENRQNAEASLDRIQFEDQPVFADSESVEFREISLERADIFMTKRIFLVSEFLKTI